MTAPARRPWHERIDPKAAAYLEQLVAEAEARRSEDEIRVALIPRTDGTLYCRVQAAPRAWPGRRA